MQQAPGGPDIGVPEMPPIPSPGGEESGKKKTRKKGRFIILMIVAIALLVAIALIEAKIV